MSQIVLPDHEGAAARTEALDQPSKTRRRHTLQECGALSETFTFSIFVAALQTLQTRGLCFFLASIVSMDTRSIQPL
jgi:hypothetical protein